MAIRWISYIWDKTDYRAGEALVALALADTANDEGRCHPKIETVAKKSRLSVRQVQRILRQLETDGFVEIVRFQGRGKEPQFQLKKVTSVTPFKDRKKVTSVTVKGDICDKKKVTSVTSPPTPPYKDNHLNEPSINRGNASAEEIPENLKSFAQNLIVSETEQVIGFAVGISIQERIEQVVPEQLKPEWLEIVRNRMVGNETKHANYLKTRIGYWLSDFQRNYRFDIEKLKFPKKSAKLPTPDEVQNAKEKYNANRKLEFPLIAPA